MHKDPGLDLGEGLMTTAKANPSRTLRDLKRNCMTCGLALTSKALGHARRPTLGVKKRTTQFEHNESAFPPTADIEWASLKDSKVPKLP